LPWLVRVQRKLAHDGPLCAAAMFAVVDHASVQCMQMLLNALALVGSNPFLEKRKKVSAPSLVPPICVF
jgi:hypothetical protein